MRTSDWSVIPVSNQLEEDQQPPIERAIADLRKLADEAEEDAAKRKSETDLSNVNPSHMALAEMQGMMKAYQQAWRLAISKREEPPEDRA